jgi:hypothetical protein
MVEHYIKMVKQHLRKVVASHQRDWDATLPIFLLAYRAYSVQERTMTALRPDIFGAPQKGTNHN